MAAIHATTLAIDIGGTGSRTLLIDKYGREKVQNFARPNRAESGLGTLERIILENRERSGLDDIELVRAGVTGFNGLVPDIEEFAEAMAGRVGVADLIVADDSVPWALGALAGGPGVTVALGTGMVALGLGSNGQLSHVDGSGPYLGDRGSGWWVGRQGLIAAIAAAEHRAGGSLQLLKLAEQRFGDLGALPDALRRDANPHAAIATFALDVVGAAEGGEPEALLILSGVGRHAASAAAAAARSSGLGPHHDLALVGGLSNASDLFDASLYAGLAEQGFHPRRVAPAMDALQGALLLEEIVEDSSVVRHWKQKEQ